MRRGARGFTLFEAAAAAVVAAILGGVLLTRLVFYQEQAELAAVTLTINAMRAGMNLRVAQLHARNLEAALPALANENPVNWLARPPPNYAGEYFAPLAGDVAAGKWYFDRSDKKMVYVLQVGKTFDDPHTKLLKYKVNLPVSASNPLTRSAEQGIGFNQVNQ